MMKKYFGITLMLTVLSTAAQVRDKKATEILDAVVEKTNSYESFKADFDYTMLNESAGIDETKEGTIWVSGDRYRLNIAGQVVICNGENLWTVLEEDEEVMLNAVEESDETITPSNLLNKYNEKYKSRFTGEITENGRVLQTIDLKPEEGKTYSKVEVVIDKENKQIVRFTIFDKNGSIYSYNIKNFESNIPLGENMFLFSEEEYPDFYLIDMR
ncbi:MAG: outer membrane lipoprotein carrier protein LolA [Bacteroidales bacterium]|nr:outer membrane lipoprotein carrier protein LolA [Bacteroidales bacterium]